MNETRPLPAPVQPPVAPAQAIPQTPPQPPVVQTTAPAFAPEKKKRAARPQARVGRILAVGGGKGGIGKSLIAANLGIALASRGKQVALIDADLGGANLHTCLGVEPPKHTLSDFIERRVAKLKDIVVPGGLPNLGLVSGAFDALDVANPRYGQKVKLLRNLQTLPFDYVILDLGAGTSFNVLDFFLAAHHGLLVLVPEPTSVENGYRFVKAAFFRRLATVQAAYGIEKLVEEAMTKRLEHNVKTPYDVIAEVRRRDPEAGAKLELEMKRFRPCVVVNEARSETDREVGPAVVAAWHKYFGLDMDYLGAIGYDDEVWKAVRKRRPVMLASPESETARSMTRIADNLLKLEAAPAQAQTAP